MTEKEALIHSAITTLNRLGYFDESDAVEQLVLDYEYAKIPSNTSPADFAKWHQEKNHNLNRIAELEAGLNATKIFIESIINANPYSTESAPTD
jgi:hypothetical protein